MLKEKTYPVEPKVWAATGVGAAFIGLLDLVSNAVQDQDTGALIGGAVPEWLEPFVTAFLTGVSIWIAGYRAKHQYREGEVNTATAAVIREE